MTDKKFVDIEEALTWLSDNWDRLKEEGKLWEPHQGDLEIRKLSEEDRKALEVVEKADYAQGYDSAPNDGTAIQRVTPAEAARIKLHKDHGLTISR